MDVKRVKKNYKSLCKIIQKTSYLNFTSLESSGGDSKLKKWCEINNLIPQRCKSPTEYSLEAISYLIYSNPDKINDLKVKLGKYLSLNCAKLDLYLKQNTDFPDYESYIKEMEGGMKDCVLQFIFLLGAYHYGVRVLYYSGDSLKEKVLQTISPTSSEDASSKLLSNTEDEYLTLFITGGEFIALIPPESSDSDSDSEKSAELLTDPIHPDRPEVRVEDTSDHNGEETEENKMINNMNKFVDEELETKFQQIDIGKEAGHQETDDADDDDTHLLNDIWKRPSENESDKKSSDNNIPKYQPNLFPAPTPSPIQKQEGNSSKLSKDARKKNHFAMRLAYQKGGAARSDEQAFNVQNRQPILMQNDRRSLIEEETKSNSNLNLSTSSRSYRPGAPKSKSSFYSNPSGTVSVSSASNYPAPKYPGGVSPQPNSHYFYANSSTNGLQMPPPGIAPKYAPKPVADPSTSHFAPQYNYSMGMMPGQPLYQPAPQPGAPPAGAPGFVQQVKPPTTTPMFAKPGNFTGEAPESPEEQKEVPPPKVGETSASSSNLTSDTTSPTVAELIVGTGMLKFFNQQHQYGFMVADKDGADIFFHYDDVKHTQLSKEFLRHATENYDVRFSFQVLDYIGKYESSKKAVNINLLSIIAK